jgi:hypothetical protein
MSYSDVLRANADMFEKAKIMLELDKKSARLERGLTNEQANNEISKELIDGKIVRLIEEKKKIMRELERDYIRNTKIMSDRHNANDTNDTLLENQTREIERNRQKLASIRNDILTLRRQLEISENDYKKKSFTIFFLKNIFIYLLFALLIALLVKNENIKQKWGFIALGVLTAVIVLIIVFNLYLNRNRNTNIFDKQDWAAPTLEESTDSTNESSFKFGVSLKADVGTE